MLSNLSSPPSPMYALTPHGHLLRGPRHRPPRRLSPAASKAAPPLPSVLAPTRPAAEDPGDLRSTLTHRLWVAAGSAAILAALRRSASGGEAESLLAALTGYALADLSSGVYHWAIDNYGGANTPAFGPQIAAFQGHHRRPSTITRRQPANNLHALARAVALSVAPIELLTGGAPAAAHAFVGAFAGCVMLSQQFHAWAHTPRGRLPAAVAAMQDAGLLVSVERHAAHHRAPYNNNYCIVSGAWNGVLDEWRVFEALEMVVFFKLGVRPRSWSEPGSEWSEEITVDQL